MLPVVVLHADQVEKHQNRLPSLPRQAGTVSLRQGEEVTHIGDARQVIHIDAPVQVADVGFQVVPHFGERPGQHTYLVAPLIVQFHVIIPGGEPFRRRGEAVEGTGENPDDKHENQGEQGDDGGGCQQDNPVEVAPGGGNLPHRRGNHQFHAAGQGGEGHLPLLSPHGIAEQFLSAAVPAENLCGDRVRKLLRRPAQFHIRVVDDAAFRVKQTGEAGVINPDTADLRNQGIQEDVHAQYANQCPRLVNRHHIGEGPRLIERTGGIGTYPGGPPLLNGGIIPGIVFPVPEIQLPRIQRLPCRKAGPAHAGTEKAVFRLADFRRDAVVVGDDPVGVVGQAAERIPHTLTVPGQILVQQGRLFRRAAYPCGGADDAFLHQGHAVQRVAGNIRGHLHRLLNAVQIRIQRELRILAQQIHPVCGAFVVFRFNRKKTRADDGQNAGEDCGYGNRRDSGLNGMHPQNLPCLYPALLCRRVFFAFPPRLLCLFSASAPVLSHGPVPSCGSWMDI